jgi:CRP-like cAMP-binding protein
MDTSAIVQAIRQTPFAHDLSESIVERLASLARVVKYRAGTVIFREGEFHDRFYLLHTGHVILQMCVAGRGCTQLLTLGPGEMLAWSTLVGNARMTTTATAQDDVELIEIVGPRLAEACDADHELGYQLMRRLATALSLRLLATRLQLLDLFAADAAPVHGAGS